MMARMLWWVSIVALALCHPTTLAAQTPLSLAEVLESSREHAPQILEAAAKVRQAEGKVLTAEGAFDTIVKGEAEQRLSGFYDGSYAAGTITRPIENWGGSLYGGYRVSSGRFPIYEDERFTNRLGEIKVGAVLSLLRDRAIDDRRAGRTLARTDVDIAETERLLTAIAIQRRAVGAYLQWVAAGLRLSVYRELLSLARERQQGLARQVTLGARPRIILTENEQNVLRRETLVVRAEQELAVAANALSLFLRDENGAPMVPDPSRLPGTLPSLPALSRDPRTAMTDRPDLAQIDMRLQQAATRLELDRNGLRPRLDLKVEASQDLGPIGAGGRSRVGTETKVGVSFTLPLQRRVAKGRIESTNAEIEALKRRRQQIEESINNMLDSISVDVRATARLSALADAERARAADMAQAERRRFTAGASDFFLVNLREESATDASIRHLDAMLRQSVAQAELVAAAADLPALGLSPR